MILYLLRENKHNNCKWYRHWFITLITLNISHPTIFELAHIHTFTFSFDPWIIFCFRIEYKIGLTFLMLFNRLINDFFLRLRLNRWKLNWILIGIMFCLNNNILAPSTSILAVEPTDFGFYSLWVFTNWTAHSTIKNIELYTYL